MKNFTLEPTKVTFFVMAIFVLIWFLPWFIVDLFKVEPTKKIRRELLKKSWKKKSLP